MDFCGCLSFISRSAFRIVELYCFMKELHDEIDCSARIACRMLNFLLPIETALFDEKKALWRGAENFYSAFLKKNN